MSKIEPGPTTRRDFLKSTSAIVAGASPLVILNRGTVFGSQQNSKVQVGIIGTGGRGHYDGKNVVKTGKAEVVALADYFDFQVQEPARTFGVDSTRCFHGIDAYREVLKLREVDAVILTEPPYFRPESFEAAVAAGKHVFAEKPIAVDPWGCRKFLEAGKNAASKKLTVVAGLQTRYEPSRQEVARKIQAGIIGQPLVGHSQRMGGDLWRRERPASFSERDHQIRHWLYYLWAGGDFIVEMHVHNLDVFNWFTGMLPVSASGSGGRSVRTDVGDIYDHLNVLFQYPNGFHLSHTGTQISVGYQGQESRIVGSQGFYDSAQGLKTKTGEEIKLGEMTNASEEEMRVFVSSILGEREYVNNSDYVATSTFTCVLGRTAAYRKEKVLWEELWNSNQRIAMPV